MHGPLAFREMGALIPVVRVVRAFSMTVALH
ncbi:MAG: hypothetical protein RL173_1692 [Fibrobacterota bacterium]|jgi:hypothetical protein